MKTKLLFSALFLSLISCGGKSGTDDPIVATGVYKDGMFVLNEGNYGEGNADVTFVRNGANEAIQDIFLYTNGENLGDVAQSISYKGNFLYIVVNGSNKIDVLNRYTFNRVGTISTGLNNPRYVAFSNNLGFVTNWGDPNNPNDDYVMVFNTLNNVQTATIPVPEGPEKILEHNGAIYVLHAGGFGFGNKVSVINPTAAGITRQITVGDVPNSAQVINNKLYVLCGGKPDFSGNETTGSLHMINLGDNVQTIISTTDLGSHPNNLVSENSLLYYAIGTRIFSQTIGNNQLPPDLMFDAGISGVTSIYGMQINGGNFYICDPLDYSSRGRLYEYSANGNKLRQFVTGFIPNNVYFN